jgi:hypothetical protein
VDKKDKMKALDLMIVLGGKPKGDDDYEDKKEMYTEDRMCKCPGCGEEFECENEDCGKTNEAGESTTDDWGNYEIVCEFCGSVYKSSSLSEDRDDYYADQEPDEDY